MYVSSDVVCSKKRQNLICVKSVVKFIFIQETQKNKQEKVYVRSQILVCNYRSILERENVPVSVDTITILRPSIGQY